jgi:glucokinase-like ROK family protein
LGGQTSWFYFCEVPVDSTVQQLIQDMYAAHGSAQGADQRVVRGFNRLLVLNYVREYGPLPRVQIAQETGLSRTTVSNIIDTLLQEGFVREGDLLDAAPVGGRRAMLVHFNADAGRILGLDVGRTHLAMILTDLQADILARTSGPFEMALGPEVCLPQLIREVRAFVESAGVPWSRIVGIGVGIPGPLDARQHTLSAPPGMPGWDGVDVWQALHQEFHVPLYLDNDANMGALSECRYGAGMGSDYLAYVKVGTGIGAGLIFNGRIFRGHGGSAGELGHMTIDENGSLCSCGNRGCLETLAGAQAIVDDARQGLSLRRTVSASMEQTALAGRKELDISEVIHAAQHGDPASRAALEHAGERIGVALAGLINLFNPACIIVGGGVARAGELLLDPLRRAASTRSLPAAWQGTRILPGLLDDTAVALGAALLVIDAAFGVATVWAGQSENSSAPKSVQTFYRSRISARSQPMPGPTTP